MRAIPRTRSACDAVAPSGRATISYDEYYLLTRLTRFILLLVWYIFLLSVQPLSSRALSPGLLADGVEDVHAPLQARLGDLRMARALPGHCQDLANGRPLLAADPF